MSKSKVQLHVYDLSNGMAKQLSPMFLGQQIDYVPHSGIVVYGIEYFYGGGVQASKPDDVARAYGMRPAEVLDLGETEIDIGTFEDFLAEIKGKYTAATYNLMRNNCNHFADECARFLLGNGIPDKIVKLPEIVLSSPLGGQLRPLLEQMDGQMNSVHGNINPFEMRRGGPAGAGAGAPVSSGSSAGAPASGGAAAAPSAVATSVLPSKVLEGPGLPAVRAKIADAAPFLKAIRSHNSKHSAASAPASDSGDSKPAAAGAGAGSGSGSGLSKGPRMLSDEEIMNVEVAAANLQRRFTKDGSDAAGGSDSESPDWRSFHECMGSCLLTWPAGAHTAWLFLLRSSLATPEGMMFFSAHAAKSASGKLAPRPAAGAAPLSDDDDKTEDEDDHGAVLVTVATNCAEGKYGALALQSALGAFANQMSHPPAVVAALASGAIEPATQAALAVLTQGTQGGVSDESALAELKKAGEKPGVRAEAAAFLRNLVLFMPVQDPGAGEGELADAAVELLFGLLGGIETENVVGVLRPRLEAAGRLLARTGETGQVLAEELGLGMGPETIASDAARPDDVRALAGEVARLFPADID